jgi:hypothetical protein
MPAWPRDITPAGSTSFVMPGAMASWGHSGKGQHRAFAQAGRIWTETLPPFRAGSPEGRRLIRCINDYWRNGTEFTIQHYSYLTRNGTGGPGSPLVNGAGQLGSNLVTDGWPPSTSNLLRDGDIIKVAGIKHVLDVCGDVSSNGSGQATIPINPPIWSGLSPADNAVITVTGVTLDAFIYQEPSIPMCAPNMFIANLAITFRESV